MKSFPERKLHHERCDNRIQLLKCVLHSKNCHFLVLQLLYFVILVLICVGFFLLDCNYFVKHSEHILCQIPTLVVIIVSL